MLVILEKHDYVTCLFNLFMSYLFVVICSKDLQWQQLSNLYENLSIKSVADAGIGQREQLFYLSVVCFLRALHGYSCATEPSPGMGN